MQRAHWIALAAVALTACMDGGRSSGPSFAISDATHGDPTGRNRFFFWLPPLVPNPNPTGVFNRFASPVVTICELTTAGTACRTDGAGHPILVAEFTMTSGTGSEVIRVNGHQQYHVNWHTDPSNLDPAKVYRIIVTVDGRDYGFADVEVGANARQLKNVNRDLYVPLVHGRTLPIKFRIEAGAACAGRESECAEAIVDPAALTRVILEDAADIPLAFGEFPAGWTDAPQLVRIDRIPDAVFGAGEGPLATDFPQYPLFFHYFTTAPHPFNRKVRIGVCNVEDSEETPYHPHHRESTVLAMGGTPADFRTLTRSAANDILGNCHGAERQPSDIGGLPGRLGDLAAQVGALATSLLAPRTLQASAMVDGGMGGETDRFSPAGTVDTASAADFTVHDLSVSPADPTSAEPITLSAIIDNAGAADAPTASVVLCATQSTAPGSGSTCEYVETPTLSPGGTASVSATFYPLIPGVYTITANVDTFEVVRESDETNNTAQGPDFTVIAGSPIIDFETFTDRSAACASCALTDQFLRRGVVFSFSSSITTLTNAQLFLSSTAYDPVDGPTNHSVTAAGLPAGGFASGTVSMNFAGLPGTVQFRLRGNNGFATFPVAAFGPDGVALPVSAVTRSSVSTYTSVSEFLFREETITVVNAGGGISRIDLAMIGFLTLVDNLLIVP